MRRLILVAFLILSPLLVAQTLTIEQIRNNIISQFNRINDYQVDIKISVKMTGFRMPKKKIHIYYKKPNKIKVETRGFAILPNIGADGNPSKFLDMLKHVTEIKRTIRDNNPFYRIMGKVNQDSLKIPVSVKKDEIPDITMEIFVDAKEWVVTEVGVYLDSESVFIFKTDYIEVSDVMVPAQSVFKIGVKGISRWTTQNPFDFGGPGSDREEFEKIAKNAGFDPEKDEFVGEMIMIFSKYKVNQGIDDALFIEKK
jgi:outer membrane lipoprotein-sorting protein